MMDSAGEKFDYFSSSEAEKRLFEMVCDYDYLFEDMLF